MFLRRRLFAAFALPLVLALAAAGCAKADGRKPVASASGTASPAAGASGDAAGLSIEEKALKFAQCMRDHGVDMPDPEVGGGKVGIRINGDSADKEKIDKAQQACRQYAPMGGKGGKPDPQAIEDARKMAQCMRDNGVESFPDPTADGDTAFDKSIAEDPDFETAKSKCDLKGIGGRRSTGERP